MALDTKAFQRALDAMWEEFGRTTVDRIRFKGEEFLFIGAEDHSSGAIAKRWQYENFETPYAHLLEDGRVARYNSEIGTRADIEWFGPDDGAEGSWAGGSEPT